MAVMAASTFFYAILPVFSKPSAISHQLSAMIGDQRLAIGQWGRLTVSFWLKAES
ncbi:MAG: hypothetical protein ACE5KL_02505 [Alphaproteobacteria bacterium]